MEFAYVAETKKDLATAIQDLEAALKDHSFSALWHLNINEKLKEKGLDLEPEFHIFEVCNAPRAKQALETNPLISFFLPCKMLVYRQDGATKIGLLRPTALMSWIDQEGIAEMAEEVEGNLRAAVDQAAQ